MSEKDVTFTATAIHDPLSTLDRCFSLCEKMSLPDAFHDIIREIYFPLSRLILEKKPSGPMLVSINGAQGTGKSTLTTFLKLIIESEFKLRVAAFSSDDFYYTRAEREKLAKEVHPLLQTRGVPGTHDIDLLVQVLEKLLEGKKCAVPGFDKARDDRVAPCGWMQYDDRVDVILFEGWCNNSPAQDSSELKNPINALEETEDSQGVWRYYTNEKLEEYHQRVFRHADMCIMLKAPDFESIYSWRSLQEQKLRSSLPADQQTRVMSDAELKRFIQHFERISRHTLKYLPEVADLVLPINMDHTIDGIIRRNDV